jgi:hypothetical protein
MNRWICPALAVLLLGACSAVRTNDAPRPFGPATEEPIELETQTGTLHGTLLLPAGRGPHPVALLVAGSGPTDRNGNTPALPGPNNSLKLLAEGLAARGIATVRYDKRGVAASAAAGPREADLRFDHYVDDAAAWIGRLRDDRRFSTVTAIGHSEGSLIALRAASRAGASGVVSIAGIARPASALLRDQLRPQLPPELWRASERILAGLEAGRTTDSVPPPIMVLYRPSVQPYLISWFRHDPAREMAGLRIPALIAQGTTDAQVTVHEARALHAARPGAGLLIVEGMNHVLKLVPADPPRQQASYSDPTLPVAPELVEGIGGFIRALRR